MVNVQIFFLFFSATAREKVNVNYKDQNQIESCRLLCVFFVCEGLSEGTACKTFYRRRAECDASGCALVREKNAGSEVGLLLARGI